MNVSFCIVSHKGKRRQNLPIGSDDKKMVLISCLSPRNLKFLLLAFNIVYRPWNWSKDGGSRAQDRPWPSLCKLPRILSQQVPSPSLFCPRDNIDWFSSSLQTARCVALLFFYVSFTLGSGAWVASDNKIKISGQSIFRTSQITFKTYGTINPNYTADVDGFESHVYMLVVIITRWREAEYYIVEG